MQTSLTIPTPPLTETDLVPRLRTGEERATTEAYHRFAGGLLTLAYRLTGPAHDAEDVVQDLFVGLPDALAHYEERGQLLPWLRRIVVRLALIRLRAGRRRAEVSLEAAGAAAGRTMASTTDVIALERALARLPEDQRAVVVLKLFEGYSHDEVAELLGIRRNASEVRLHRALTRLRDLLEER